MSTVIINGKKMNISGNNICISNDRVYVDGKLISDEEAKEPVKLIVEGDLLTIKTEGDVEVNGNVQGDLKAGGSVNSGDVGGSLKAGGSVHSGDVNGSVKADGSVHCGDVGGDIEADGSVSYRRK